jgi:hypothetical protein
LSDFNSVLDILNHYRGVNEMDELIKQIKSCTNMKELDALRLDLVTFGAGKPEVFKTLQNEFVKRKNKIKRGGMQL